MKSTSHFNTINTLFLAFSASCLQVACEYNEYNHLSRLPTARGVREEGTAWSEEGCIRKLVSGGPETGGRGGGGGGTQTGLLVGCRDGAVVRARASHQCGPGLIPGLGVICGLSLLLVFVFSLRGFSLGTPVFPSPQKPTLLNSNSIWKVSPISALR